MTDASILGGLPREFATGSGPDASEQAKILAAHMVSVETASLTKDLEVARDQAAKAATELDAVKVELAAKAAELDAAKLAAEAATKELADFKAGLEAEKAKAERLESRVATVREVAAALVSGDDEATKARIDMITAFGDTEFATYVDSLKAIAAPQTGSFSVSGATSEVATATSKTTTMSGADLARALVQSSRKA